MSSNITSEPDVGTVVRVTWNHDAPYDQRFARTVDGWVSVGRSSRFGINHYPWWYLSHANTSVEIESLP